MTHEQEQARKEAEFRRLFAKLTEKEREKALLVMRSLQFAQSVIGPAAREDHSPPPGKRSI